MQSAVRIELGARSDTEPSATPDIQPYIADALPDALGPSSFRVRAVAPERTFWEKAMLLHEESYRREGPKGRLSRHYYDLWCLIRGGIAEKALADASLFERVASHRSIFFRRNREAQGTLRRGSLRLMPTQDHLPLWQRDYDAMREVMFFGETPELAVVTARTFRRPERICGMLAGAPTA